MVTIEDVCIIECSVGRRSVQDVETPECEALMMVWRDEVFSRSGFSRKEVMQRRVEHGDWFIVGPGQAYNRLEWEENADTSSCPIPISWAIVLTGSWLNKRAMVEMTLVKWGLCRDRCRTCMHKP